MKKAFVALFGLVSVLSLGLMLGCKAQDSTPPEVSITVEPTENRNSSVEGEVVKGIVNLVATATDNVGVDTLRFYLKGEPLGNVFTSPSGDSEDTYVYEWHSQDLRNNDGESFEISAKAWDGAGNVGESQTLTYTVLIPNQNPEPAIPAFPKDDGKVQSVSIILKWVGMDLDSFPLQALQYDVYFGESSSSLEMVAESLSGGVSPDTGTWGTLEWEKEPNHLVPLEDYYWKIVTRDPYELETETPVFRFMRDSNRAPFNPALSSPDTSGGGAVIAPPPGDTVKLAWTPSDPDGDAQTFTLYFGPRPDTGEIHPADLETVVDDIEGSSYWMEVSPGTVYYWRVIAIDQWDAVSGDPETMSVWRFEVTE